MKSFTRSVIGKTIIFILLVASCLSTATCALCELVYWDSNMYYVTEDTFIEQTMEDMVRSKEDDFIWQYFQYRGGFDKSYIDRYFGENRTNLLIQYALITPQGEEKIYRNSDYIHQIVYESCFIPKWDENGEFAGYEYVSEAAPEEKEDQNEPIEYYRLKMGLKSDLPVEDEFRIVSKLTHLAYTLHKIAIPLGIISVIAALILFILLMTVSARRPDTEEIIPGLLNWVPFDILTVVIGGTFLALGLCVIEIIESTPSVLGFLPVILLCFLLLIVCICLFFGWCMSLAARIKQHNLLKNTLIGKICSIIFKIIRTPLRWAWNFILSIPFIWKTLVIWCIYFFVQSMIIADGSRETVFFYQTLTAFFLLYCVYALFKVNRKAKSISNGYYEQSLDKSLLFGFRELDQSLTKINSGLSVAVEQRMKSERMKTELITNVSHDIKTPLTSIINYADLIGKEETDNPVIKEYSEVLHRQSVKLKRLIEDLIEASKASTGNIELNMEQCDLNVIISQITGEYDEKLKEAELTLITKTPQEPVMIMADGRRLWRVFDNLMGNIIKYAMHGTRVYISMAKQNGEAILVFKNTSENPIDLSPEELTERFVRGDESRNTEGNGLGLSIAKSLVELQGGVLSLYSDGDLFKVILRFPLINE